MPRSPRRATRRRTTRSTWWPRTSDPSLSRIRTATTPAPVRPAMSLTVSSSRTGGGGHRVDTEAQRGRQLGRRRGTRAAGAPRDRAVGRFRDLARRMHRRGRQRPPCRSRDRAGRAGRRACPRPVASFRGRRPPRPGPGHCQVSRTAAPARVPVRTRRMVSRHRRPERGTRSRRGSVGDPAVDHGPIIGPMVAKLSLVPAERRLLVEARRATLATIAPRRAAAARADLLRAVHPDDAVLYSPLDDKPKRSADPHRAGPRPRHRGRPAGDRPRGSLGRGLVAAGLAALRGPSHPARARRGRCARAIGGHRRPASQVSRVRGA